MYYVYTVLRVLRVYHMCAPVEQLYCTAVVRGTVLHVHVRLIVRGVHTWYMNVCMYVHVNTCALSSSMYVCEHCPISERNFWSSFYRTILILHE